MSLRIRLTLIVSLLFVVGMLLGLSFLISSARQRVADEVGAAAVLTVELLESMLLDTPVQDRAQLLRRLQGIENARHLDIYLQGAEDTIPERSNAARAPSWFVYLVQAQELHYALRSGNGDERIIIRTNPTYEIAEVWLETRNFFGLLLLVLLALNGFLYFTLGRWLAPVSAIVAGLEGAEQGDFSGQVSNASLPELKAIADKLNQLTRVLRASKEENDRLTQRALVIQEDERRHLARELHDELGQSISAIKAIAFSISQRTRATDGMSAEGATRIGMICNDVSGHVRGMMSRLRPTILDELGLVAALQVMVDEWNRAHRETFCSFRAGGNFDRLDADQQINLYRIVQEALTNAARHARAERVDVALTQDSGRFQLTLSDDGCGYEPGAAQTGMGLSGIRERCQALHGTLNVVTSPGAGVRMELVFGEP